MRSFVSPVIRLEIFTEKLLKYAGFNNCERETKIPINGYTYRPDYTFEKNNQKYAVEVKLSLNIDVGKSNHFINRFNELKLNNYNNIIIVYDNVKSNIKEQFKDVAVILDISNVLYILKDNTYLFNELIGLLNYSVKNIELKKPDIDIEIEEKETIDHQNKIKLLESISKGQTEYKTYQTFCIDTLKYLFRDNLDLWEEQEKTDDGLNIYDLICKIKNNVTNEFFTMLETYFKSKYIIFEFKNYEDKISQYEVCTTEKYLYETALRKVAIIISREGINDNGDKMTKGILRENGKLIIVLNDEDIKTMIRYKEDGEDPSLVLTNKLDFLLTHLEK